jgi:hypothetical protein
MTAPDSQTSAEAIIAELDKHGAASLVNQEGKTVRQLIHAMSKSQTSAAPAGDFYPIPPATPPPALENMRVTVSSGGLPNASPPSWHRTPPPAQDAERAAQGDPSEEEVARFSAARRESLSADAIIEKIAQMHDEAANIYETKTVILVLADEHRRDAKKIRALKGTLTLAESLSEEEVDALVAKERHEEAEWWASRYRQNGPMKLYPNEEERLAALRKGAKDA